jgi:hypothetical protein
MAQQGSRPCRALPLYASVRDSVRSMARCPTRSRPSIKTLNVILNLSLCVATSPGAFHQIIGQPIEREVRSAYRRALSPILSSAVVHSPRTPPAASADALPVEQENASPWLL